MGNFAKVSNRLNDIMFHAQRCELYDDEHRLYAKMGLGITIYFYGGGSESGQRKVLDVFKRYQEEYDRYLNGLFGSEQGKRFVKFNSGQFIKTIGELSSHAKKIKEFFCSSVLNEKGIMPVITPVKP